ncbi:MAG TPA: S8 family serine peptidase, partial [Chitinophagales bacterium]|nr:S8 family serine peptidase [Chitinophagales bacterium]
MNARKLAPVFLLLSGWSLFAFGQIDQAQEKVAKSTNVKLLQQLADSLRAVSAAEKEIALKKAKEKGWKERIELDDGKVAELIRLDKAGNPVYYITNNANAAATISTTALYPGGSLGLSLEGEGMVVGEWDAGAVRYSHEQLSGGRVFLSDNAPFFDNHSTHVAGTMIGDGTPQGNAKGMAPKASLKSYDWNYDGAEMAVAGAGGLLVSNHSYGNVSGWFYNGTWHWFGNPALNPNESYLFGYYDDEARTWDNIAYNAPYYLIVKSAGNDRSDTGPAPGTAHTHMGTGSYTDTHPPDGNSGTGYDCLPTKSSAKNILTIGAVADIPGGYSGPGSVLMSGFSGWGPTDDGRIKPDVVGNGISLYSSVASSDNSYASFSGTSMSSPNVAGSCILLQEHYRNIHPGNFMRAATLKALVIHTADEAGPSDGPDYSFGWGLMNTKSAAALITLDGNLESHIQENILNNGTSFTHHVAVDGTQPLIATICWTHVPGNAENAAVDNPGIKLVNDLDMRLINGTTTLPYVLDPANPSNPATTGDNFRDNVEKIYIANPAAGIYTVRVTHKGTLAGGSQAFSLILSGISISSCSDPHSVNAAQVNGNSVNVSWSPGNTSVSWIVEYGAAGFYPGSGTVVSGNYPGTSAVILSNLSSGLYYDVYVKEFCAGGTPTNLIGPLRFYVIPTIAGAYCENFDRFNICGNSLFECVQNGTCDGALTSTGWENAINDNIDWSVADSATPSLNTGPENDHTTGSGKFLFTEASNCFNHTAILQSPAFDLNTVSNPSLSFWYHMLGSAMGTLSIQAERPIGSGQWTTVWTITGNQGQNWNNANISLSAYSGDIVRFRFLGTTGANFESDIAIDDICISSSCPDASACNDHNPCTADECVSGICFNPPLCTDSDACTVDLCLNGTCRHNPIPGCSPCTNALATVFNGSTAQNGNMFDVTALNTVKILSFKGHFSGTIDFEIYYKPGSHVGYENNAAAWNLIGSATGTNSNGMNSATPIPIPINIIIPAGETYAFYITGTDGSMRYSFGTAVGNTASQDANIIIREGTSNVYPFSSVFSPRIWNGEISYVCSGFNECAVNQCSGGVCLQNEISCPDDDNPCTVNKGCTDGQCEYLPLCDDGNPCTIDECDAGTCTYTAIPNCDPCAAVDCDDNNACTDDVCVNGSCSHPSVNCDDSDNCTSDGCNPAAGCMHSPMSCSDGNACTDDGCSSGQCTHAPANCDDNDLCTTDGCNTLTGCTHTPADCSDNNACTTDGCANGECTHAPANCNDNNACTTDDCNIISGCTHVQMNCSDSNNCTADVCVDGICFYYPCNDNNPCTDDACVSGECAFTPKVCTDGNLCTTDGCASGNCVFTSIICNDGNLCTVDACVPATGACAYTPLNCNDNDVCTIDNCVRGQCTHECDLLPRIDWQKSLGGTVAEEATAIRQTSDGGYIAAGYTSSNNGNVTGNHGLMDYWVVRLDAAGNILWQKALGGTSDDKATSVQQTSDGGFVVAGYAISNNGNVSGNHGGRDVWIVKLDAGGNIQWQKALGGSSTDEANAIQQTTDGGYIMAGWTFSTNGDVTGNHGMHDFWVVKLNATGSIVWQKCLGGSSIDIAYSVRETSDGNYIVAGSSYSTNGDVTLNRGTSDYWVVKLNAGGSIMWQKSFGGSAADQANSVQPTSDGGYIVAGYSASYNGDVTGSHGSRDYWVVKLNASGALQWQKALGGTQSDEATSVIQTSDGGYAVTGYASSNNGNVSSNHGGQDFWTVKLDASGNIQWQRTHGGSANEKAYAVAHTGDGGFVLAGSSDSNNGDVSGNQGGADFWIVKLGSCVPVTTVYASACAGTQPGTTIDTLTSSNGCDSIVVTHYTPVTVCDDNDPCTTDECINNVCVFTSQPQHCDDNNCSTTDVFNPLTCRCEHTFIPPPDCDDNNCNTADAYNSISCQCEHTLIPPPGCDDNDCKTNDIYNAATCQCEHPAIPPPD